jgi:hypothetical protein
MDCFKVSLVLRYNANHKHIASHSVEDDLSVVRIRGFTIFGCKSRRYF